MTNKFLVWNRDDEETERYTIAEEDETSWPSDTKEILPDLPDFVRQSLARDADSNYYYGSSGSIYKLDEDLNLVWENSSFRDSHRVAVDDEYVYTIRPEFGNSINLLDKDTGEEVDTLSHGISEGEYGRPYPRKDLGYVAISGNGSDGGDSVPEVATVDYDGNIIDSDSPSNRFNNDDSEVYSANGCGATNGYIASTFYNATGAFDADRGPHIAYFDIDDNGNVTYSWEFTATTSSTGATNAHGVASGVTSDGEEYVGAFTDYDGGIFKPDGTTMWTTFNEYELIDEFNSDEWMFKEDSSVSRIDVSTGSTIYTASEGDGDFTGRPYGGIQTEYAVYGEYAIGGLVEEIGSAIVEGGVGETLQIDGSIQQAVQAIIESSSGETTITTAEIGRIADVLTQSGVADTLLTEAQAISSASSITASGDGSVLQVVGVVQRDASAIPSGSTAETLLIEGEVPVEVDAIPVGATSESLLTGAEIQVSPEVVVTGADAETILSEGETTTLTQAVETSAEGTVLQIIRYNPRTSTFNKRNVMILGDSSNDLVETE